MPTNDQIALTLLRIGEAYKTPLPPVPASKKDEPYQRKPIDVDKIPLDASRIEKELAIMPPTTVGQTSTKDDEGPKHKHLSKILRVIKGQTKAAVETKLAIVIGMLVRYGTDHVVSIGQVRLDSMGEPIAVADTNELGIQVGRVGQKYLIADINVYPENLSSVWADVIIVPREGTLIWWFLPCTSLLQHYENGRVSRLFRSRGLRTLLL